VKRRNDWLALAAAFTLTVVFVSGLMFAFGERGPFLLVPVGVALLYVSLEVASWWWSS
jgi:hypothetical protein